jgi:hypothetical protein
MDKSRKFSRSFSDVAIFTVVLIANVQVQVVPKVVYFKIKVFAFPDWFLACVFLNRRLPLLLAASHFDVRVHLSEELGVVG